MLILITCCLFVGMLLIFRLTDIINAIPEFVLEVLNPQGEIEPPKAVGISPRISDLAGKTIGLYDIGKNGFENFLDVTEKLLKEKYPSVTIKRYNGAFDLGEKLALKISKEVDTVIYGVGD